VRPWRTATLVASAIAAIELVALIGIGVAFVAKPLSNAVQKQAETAAFAPPKKAQEAIRQMKAASVATPKLGRASTRVMVLNGNGHAGAASTAAARLHGIGYAVAGTGNAKRQDYASSVVLYKPGFRPEALRLARDLKIKVVGPLDGMQKSALMGGQLAVILGA
jgi:hypothetical protein